MVCSGLSQRVPQMPRSVSDCSSLILRSQSPNASGTEISTFYTCSVTAFLLLITSRLSVESHIVEAGGEDTKLFMSYTLFIARLTTAVLPIEELWPDWVAPFRCQNLIPATHFGYTR